MVDPANLGDSVRARFDLAGRVAIITGGAGLLGIKHAETIAELGGIPVLVDTSTELAQAVPARLRERFGIEALAVKTDITARPQVDALVADLSARFGRIDILRGSHSAPRSPTR